MWIWLAAPALAGDLSLYNTALRLVDEHYLWPERLDHEAMFRAAAERLEDKVEPVLVEATGAQARIEVGPRRWNVVFHGDLPAALSELEDAVRGSGVRLKPDLDLRAELLKGALSTLDRHTVLLVGEGLERFDERLSGTLSGIGVTLRLSEGALVVSEIYPNSPAERAGLTAGDRVTDIDGIATEGMTPLDATAHIRGRAGTTVTLAVAHGAESRTVELVRAEITIPNVMGEAGPRGVGVVRIDHFSEQTVPNLERVLDELRSRGLLDLGLVLDLRGNSGGSLVQSAKSVDTFVDEGRIVTTNGRGGEHVPGLLHAVDAHADSRGPLPPVVVLVDHDTASGAEILSGALAQLGRATLVGETTFGKGTVQTLWSLGEGIKLKLTVAEYTVGDDVHVHEVGIVPDVALYPVELGGGRFWYPDAARLRARLRADTPLLYYPDLGGEPANSRDDALDLAAAILTSGTEPTRESVLRAETLLLPTLTALEASRLAEASQGLSLDWSPAVGTGSPVIADVEVNTLPSPLARAGERAEVQFTVTNHGAALSRAAIRLRSVNPDVDDRVLPIGRLAAGETRVVRDSILPSLATPARMDRVVGVLECDGCMPVPVVDSTFVVEAVDAPALKVVASIDEETLRIELTNVGSMPLTGLRAHVPYPDIPGVELSQPADHPLALLPGASAVVTQHILFGAGAEAGPLSLRLDVATDGFAELVHWELPLTRGGGPIHRDAPTIEAVVPRAHQPPGVAVVQLHITDLDGLDHVVVFAGSERVDRLRWDANVSWDQDKLLYRGTLGKRAHLAVPVPVRAGSNRIVVVAEDRQGVRTRREFYIFGEGDPRPDDGVAFGP